MPNDPRLLLRESYPLWTGELVRFGDTDRLGHVNNAKYATYLETARVALMQRLLKGPETYFVLARMAIDYRAELRELGPIEIGTAVTGIGRSSFTTGQGVFQGPLCAATGEGVVVLVEAATRRATPLPEALRAALQGLALPPQSG
ncbi:acyl-CoA thioesterase [Pseudoroseomonas cervicalis]|uniref:Acyl-CoA thioester hydrolase, YbgC/YbaW family n=1 Tax=Pseudoroseomonas cervicalis ATCC 49957 TaxID=525371 RepID=D5RK39_9PROT|nr:thioesterase family protein [Pseudoroseomonas cervicalis]EFH12321.1 acyl-CoA thioester hydrolase, YbgC/YbaW family [Pseudoroseomonas cervicalis ATCC 49957]